MKKLLLTLMIGSTVLAGAPTLAFAQTTPPPPPGAANPAYDRDRVVTREEAVARADRMFDAIDTNHDGKITPDEMRAARERRHDKMGETAPPMGANNVPPPPPSDGDRHGMGMGMGKRGGDPNRVITREEWRQKAMERFDRVDLNHDGRITPDERKAAREEMRGKFRERMDMRRDRRAPPPTDGSPAPAPAPAPTPGND